MQMCRQELYPLYPIILLTEQSYYFRFNIIYYIFNTSYDANVQPGTRSNTRDELLNRLCQPPDGRVCRQVCRLSAQFQSEAMKTFYMMKRADQD